MWFTVHKLGETSRCSVESETCNQYSARRANGQLTAEPNSSMGFHDHIVARDPKNVHNDKQWSDQTHWNAVFDLQRTIMYVWLCALEDICLYLYHYTTVTRVSHDAKLHEAPSKICCLHIPQILLNEFDSAFCIKTRLWISGVKATLSRIHPYSSEWMLEMAIKVYIW